LDVVVALLRGSFKKRGGPMTEELAALIIGTRWREVAK
tara:strand:+ start:1110 stop:1223 length:114 start_codon:yes stop_codon:yes gene_type:complete